MSTTIRLEQLSKSYGNGKKSVLAVDGIDLTIPAGQFFFLLGPSGCGKTTILHMIAGLIEPTSGRIYFNQQDMTSVPTEKRQTAMVFQNYALWPHMTVLENVLFGPKMQHLEKSCQLDRARRALELTHMQAYGLRRPGELSGGQQQRVALARALAAQPQCLLLDEPLSNLDAKLRAQMCSELKDLIKNAGITAIYVTHDQTEALAMADAIAVMRDGRIVQVGAPQDIYRQPKNAFCAEFMGKANLIAGAVIQSKPAVIQTDIGRLTSAHNTPFAVGQRVLCCIRPEHIQAQSEAASHTNNINSVAATVKNSTYLGALLEAQWLLPNQQIWQSSHLAQDVGFSNQRQYRLTIAPEHVVILPPED